MTTSNGKKSSGRYVHSTSSSRKATVKQRNQTIKHVAVRRTKRSRLRLTVPGARDEDLLVGGSDIEDIDPASEGNEDDNDVFVDALEDFNALENSEEAVDPLEELVKAMELEFEELERQLLDEQSKQPKAPNEKVKKAPARPLKDWIPHRQRLVDQLLAQDGLGESASIPDCQLCGVKPGTMKCRDCFGMALLCQECTLNAHLRLPLHRILQWNGVYFESIALCELQLTVQLGHHGSSCPNPSNAIEDFTVVDVSGIHTINLRFCACHGAPPERDQLITMTWFPASIERPHTSFTFDVLDTFLLLNVQAKTSLFDYNKSLEQKSDAAGVLGLPHRYQQFLPIVRLYRHVMMLKRSGRGHDPAGVAATKAGECAVECPACPHPGRNLPEGWDQSPESIRWLYRLILTADANFKLKLKEKGVVDDPPLGDGWGHWVESKPFQAYVKVYGTQIEPNSCDSNLRAVDLSQSRYSSQYKSSGQGAVLCARHTFLKKMGDMQRGEAFANMDFIWFSVLLGTCMLFLTLSYDICCQWGKNLISRMPQLPDYLHIDVNRLRTAIYVIPKLHIWGHGPKCLVEYSLNFIRWMAVSDGEDPERWWAHMNPVSMSTREMGEGSRHDTLDDHARSWNWAKLVGFGTLFKKRLKKAIIMRAKHRQAFVLFNEGIPPDVSAKWDKLVRDWDESMKVKQWDAKKRKKNPYDEPHAGVCTAQIRLELAKEEAAEAAKGNHALHDTSPSQWLRIGLELEESQRLISWHSKRKNASTLSLADLHDNRTKLLKRLTPWSEVQRLYMPCVTRLRISDSQTDDNHSSSEPQPAEAYPLYLPSSISPTLWGARDCLPGLVLTEMKLRLAQADDTLDELRRQLRMSCTLRDYKRAGATSQRMSTRAYSQLTKFKEKTTRCAERYTAAFDALKVLDPGGAWSQRLQPLDHKTDLRAPRRDDEDNPSETSRILSWIWLVPKADGSGFSEEELDDTMRVEWARSLARADRWEEEVLLVTEEMRRVIVFLDWKADWWEGERSRRVKAPAAVKKGLHAYASKQADLYRTIAGQFAEEWSPYLKSYNIQVEWPDHYVLSPSSPSPMHED